MANVVNVQLLHVDGRTYRVRAQPIGGKPLPQQQQQQHYEDEEEAAAAAWEEAQGAGEADDAAADELIDESLISQEGDIFVTRISVDPQVCGCSRCVLGLTACCMCSFASKLVIAMMQSRAAALLLLCCTATGRFSMLVQPAT
jgi:hypothetical protein